MDALEAGVSVWDYCLGSGGSREAAIMDKACPEMKKRLNNLLEELHQEFLPESETHPSKSLTALEYCWFALLDVLAVTAQEIIKTHFPESAADDDVPFDDIPFFNEADIPL